jgi:hypothetical protein
MRQQTTALGFAALMATCAAGVGAFNEQGHRVVGRVAELHLRNSRALQEVTKVLRPNETLADAAVWPDTIKQPTYEDGDTNPFRLEHPAHETYHYANLPFQVNQYDPSVPGARATDVVQMARECIRVLRGSSRVFTSREALRLLAHYVGDMHQPLHVGTGFVAADGPLQFVLPQGPTGWRVTAGGNALVYGPQDRFNLHSYWDAHAVNLAMRQDDVAAFASRLVETVAITPVWTARGDVDSWPQQWAEESLQFAKVVHQGVRLLTYLGPDDSGRTPHRWRIDQPGDYDNRARGIVRIQLAKGGYRLAAVLKAIWPDR